MQAHTDRCLRHETSTWRSCGEPNAFLGEMWESDEGVQGPDWTCCCLCDWPLILASLKETRHLGTFATGHTLDAWTSIWGAIDVWMESRNLLKRGE